MANVADLRVCRIWGGVGLPLHSVSVWRRPKPRKLQLDAKISRYRFVI